jgi:hypothetical protein
MEEEPDTCLVGIHVDMVDPVGIESAGPPHDAMNLVTF